MGYAYSTRLQKFQHQKNTRVGKKDVRCVQFLLKLRIFDVHVVIHFLEENQDQTKNQIR